MKLGFVTAILPDQTLEEIFQIAKDIGYDCVEVMCWPKGKAERRYAGVTHIDVTDFNKDDAQKIIQLSEKYGIEISALGYYPNPLVADLEEAQIYSNHIKKVIDASSLLGLSVMNSFVGRDQHKSIEGNWERFTQVWSDIISYAEQKDVRVGIENCPMLFTKDEWPGGKNLATTPDIWAKMYESIPSKYFGLNFDPSHFIWQHMDYLSAMKTFAQKLFHVHAKDARIDKEELDKYGIMAHPNLWHTPVLPGLGSVNWESFFETLKSVGYSGPVCVEVEDRNYEGSLEKRLEALTLSYNNLIKYLN